MTFDKSCVEVQGVPVTAKLQVPEVLSNDMKRRLTRKTPEEVAAMVTAAIEDVNKGSVKPLDELIRKCL